MKIQIFTIFIILLSSVSCNNDYPKEEQKLVIEGWIENGEIPVVLVGLSGNINNDGDNIADFMVRWAKVSISDGDSTYILTGGMDKNYFPPFVYKCYDLRGEPGKTYTLEVEYNDMKAYAVTSIPEPIEIDTIEIKNTLDNNWLRAINVVLNSKSSQKEYFRLRYRDYDSETRIYPSFMGTFYTEHETLNKSFPLYRAKRATLKDYTPYFSVGTHLEVRLGHISEDSYNIWCDYDNAVYFSSNVFFKQQTDLRSNIVNGYGYWIGYGISKRKFIVE